MSVATTIARLRAEEALIREFSIRALYIFGSVARGEESPGSDIDILVEFEPGSRIGLFAFARLQRRLSELLEKRVDLVTRDGLHRALKDRILKEAVRAA
ncbi:MAG: nucleotidyltransferase [Acidobacteria bacterium]|nr:MAG: nucleotidyltransferase [Acidobacteriota bacterium]